MADLSFADTSLHKELPDTAGDTGDARETKISCLNCRTAKRKCITPDALTICRRCKAQDLSCDYRKHRRGRVKKVEGRPRITGPATVTMQTSPSGAEAEPSNIHNQSSAQDLPALPDQPAPVLGQQPPSSADLISFNIQAGASDAESSATQGDIQFSHVVPDGGDSSPFLPRAVAGPSTGPSARTCNPNPLQRQLRAECPDPVQAGIVKESDTVELFSVYFNRLNTTVPVLDQHYHTPAFCRTHSPLLFTAILTVSSKIARPRVYAGCLMLANKLLGQIMQYDLCTVEIVQAINVLTHWKKADDAMSWRRIGLAIRMAQELKLDTRGARPLPPNELDAREVLNRERAWLNLIIADYHLAIHHSLPRMISEERQDDVEDWLKEHDHLRCPGDTVLPAMITWSRMCRLYKDMLSAMNGDASNLRLLHWVEGEWKRWRIRWIETDCGFLPQQLATFKHCDAYFRFHLAEYRLLFVSRYKSSGQKLDINQASPLSLAFGECVDAALGLSTVFALELAAQGLLPYCFNLVWVSLAVTSIWLAKNIVTMGSSERLRVIKALSDTQSATEEASRSSDDMCGYITRLLKHLMAGVNPEWQLASLISRPLDDLFPPQSLNTGPRSEQNVQMWAPSNIQQVIRDQLWTQPIDSVQQPADGVFSGEMGTGFGDSGEAGPNDGSMVNTSMPIFDSSVLFPSDEDDIWRVLFPATDSLHDCLL